MSTTSSERAAKQDRTCPTCLSSPSRARLAVRDHVSGECFHAQECTVCGLVFIVDPPAAADLGRYYDNAAGTLMHNRPHPLVERARSVAMRQEIRELLSMLPADAKILDFGSGDGSLSRLMLEAGYDVFATDLFPPQDWHIQAVTYRQYSTAAAVSEVLDGFPRLDAITMRHVLEHVPQPRRLLEDFAAKDVTLVHLVVPNIDSRLARRLGEAWYFWDPPRHLTFFSPRSLALMAQAAGYEVVSLHLRGLDEVVTSAYRRLLLAAHATPDRASRLRRLAAPLAPTGLLASASSAAVSAFGTGTIRAVLRRRG